MYVQTFIKQHWYIYLKVQILLIFLNSPNPFQKKNKFICSCYCFTTFFCLPHFEKRFFFSPNEVFTKFLCTHNKSINSILAEAPKLKIMRKEITILIRMPLSLFWHRSKYMYIVIYLKRNKKKSWRLNHPSMLKFKSWTILQTRNV